MYVLFDKSVILYILFWEYNSLRTLNNIQMNIYYYFLHIAACKASVFPQIPSDALAPYGKTAIPI